MLCEECKASDYWGPRRDVTGRLMKPKHCLVQQFRAVSSEPTLDLVPDDRTACLCCVRALLQEVLSALFRPTQAAWSNNMNPGRSLRAHMHPDGQNEAF